MLLAAATATPRPSVMHKKAEQRQQGACCTEDEAPSPQHQQPPYPQLPAEQHHQAEQHQHRSIHQTQQPSTQQQHQQQHNAAIPVPEFPLSQPLVFAVGHMGPQYWEWVDRPVPGRPRFFGPNALERCSHTVWWVVPALWLPVWAAMTAAATRSAGGAVASLVAQQLCGIVLWQVSVGRELCRDAPLKCRQECIQATNLVVREGWVVPVP